MNNLIYRDFKDLLKYRTYNRRINYNSASSVYNCIKNSIWYYPGQLVPDTSQRFKQEEFDNERKLYFEITFSKIIKHKKYQKDLFVQLFGDLNPARFENGIYDFYLSDVLKKLLPRPGGFRLLMFTSCRYFERIVSFKRQKQMIELELYYSRINTINDLKILSLDKKLPPPDKLKFRCNHCTLGSENKYCMDYYDFF